MTTAGENRCSNISQVVFYLKTHGDSCFLLLLLLGLVLLLLRPALDFPDALALMDEAEGAPDPLFGVMYMPHAMPSPNSLIQVQRSGREESFNSLQSF